MTTAPTAPTTPTPTASRPPVASVVWFAFMTAMWSLFGVLLATGALDDVQRAVGDQPALLEALLWVLGLPWLLATAAWESSWAPEARVAVVAALVLAWSWLSWPRRARPRPAENELPSAP
jgi:hypothetical protein